METIKIAGISGSLRKGSYNTMLLNAAAKVLPEGTELNITYIDALPHYNADLDIPAVEQRPQAVQVLRDALAQADAILISSPEYNYSIPGALKNAIDWASRGADSPLLNKPVAIIGATPGMFGTVRMQAAFLPVFQFLNMVPAFKPEVLVSQANQKFDQEGNLTDKAAEELIGQKLKNLRDLAVQRKAK